MTDPWISMEDKQPDDYRPAYQVKYDNGKEAIGYWDMYLEKGKFTGEGFWIVDGAREPTVTHWQPHEEEEDNG